MRVKAPFPQLKTGKPKPGTSAKPIIGLPKTGVGMPKPGMPKASIKRKPKPF